MATRTVIQRPVRPPELSEEQSDEPEGEAQQVFDLGSDCRSSCPWRFRGSERGRGATVRRH